MGNALKPGAYHLPWNKVIINVGEQTINRYNNQDTPPSYSVNVVPHTVLISKDGIVIAEMPGTQGREAFLKALELAKN